MKKQPPSPIKYTIIYVICYSAIQEAWIKAVLVECTYKKIIEVLPAGADPKIRKLGYPQNSSIPDEHWLDTF